ncbi:MAG: rod shape-determining protein MreB [Thalassotalea sp.]
MLKLFTSHFKITLYAQIWENRIKVVNVETGQIFDEKPHLQVSKTTKGNSEAVAFGNSVYRDITNPFSHPRVLLANFFCAEKLLNHIISLISSKMWLYGKPDIIIHPREKLEGGLTQVEIRAFKELGEGAGAVESFIYLGEQELNISDTNFEQIKKECAE